MENNNVHINGNVTLPMSLIHDIFDTYIGPDYKLLIHKEGSSDEDRSRILSIELIMLSRMEEYFKDVLLSDRLKSKLCNEACKRGYVNTLKWAREYGCEWDRDTCMAAAWNGHLDCLKYAREHGCVWDGDTCSAAAENGHLDCLKYAREHGCE